LEAAHADCFLEQHPACVLFIRNQFIDRFPVPFGLSAGRGNALLLQRSGDIAQAVAAEVAVEDPANNGGLVGC